MQAKGIEMYHEYVSKAGDRYSIFESISQYDVIKKALYPGSYIHITPSLIIPEVIYVDTDKKAIKFFQQETDIKDFVASNKVYPEPCSIQFEAKDYWEELSIPLGYVDLLISQYAGFVSQACKGYLKKGGILLANDSHGDATLAKADKAFEFIGTLQHKQGSYKMESKDIEKHFTRYQGRPVDLDKVKETMKGPKYLVGSDYYVFRKIRG